MLPADEALRQAQNVKNWAVGMCDQFVAKMYGFDSSGYATASVHWNSIPSNLKHPGDPNAPAGALMFWGGGAGHVAISDGKGGIVSTDMPSPGTVSDQPASTPSTSWHKPYLGWSEPYFQGQAGTTGNTYTGPGSIGGSTALPASSTTGLNLITSALGIDTVDLVERGALMFFGAILVIVGLWKFTGTGAQVVEVMKNAAGVEGTKTQAEARGGIRHRQGRSSVLRNGEGGESTGTETETKETPTQRPRRRVTYKENGVRNRKFERTLQDMVDAQDA